MLVGSVSFGVKSLHDLSSSVNELNAKIAVVIDQVGHQSDELREHASRIHDIENQIMKGNN
jgi:outer membrane murein-binding lipoprotein Lpp